MKSFMTMLVALSVLALCLGTAGAADKEVTLKGKIVCPKCALGEGTKCQNAIQVQEGGKTVIYYFLDKGSKESYHEEVCGADGKQGTVTGVVSEKDGKKSITPKKVVYADAGKK